MAKDANPDVIVIGAGAAGISAATELAAAGLKVAILEARDRIGGRMFTVIDPVHRLPVELGAEFIHGLAPEIWDPLNRNNVTVTEVDGDEWCSEDGRLGTCDFFSDVDEILQKMDDHTPDKSFLEFLKTYPHAAEAARRQRAEKWASSYVTGFNAADPALVGVHWLIQGMRADEKIEGGRSFRAKNGYADLLDIFLQQLQTKGVSLHTSAVVQSVKWSRGLAEVNASSPKEDLSFFAPRVLITVPLGVLQARTDEKGAIQFTPDLPPRKKAAIGNIAMGKIIRVTLRFRERFWTNLPKSHGSHSNGPHSKTMDDMSFLFSHDDWFPTWWTTMPQKSPLLVGWAPFHCAERLSGENESFIVERSICTLNRLLGVSTKKLESLLDHAYLHDWQSDPFARGAYSYGKTGEEGAPHALAAPIEDTLYFAGEATDLSGHTGTVHGAIASGRRATAEILQKRKGEIKAS